MHLVRKAYFHIWQNSVRITSMKIVFLVISVGKKKAALHHPYFVYWPFERNRTRIFLTIWKNTKRKQFQRTTSCLNHAILLSCFRFVFFRNKLFIYFSFSSNMWTQAWENNQASIWNSHEHIIRPVCSPKYYFM